MSFSFDHTRDETAGVKCESAATQWREGRAARVGDTSAHLWKRVQFPSGGGGGVKDAQSSPNLAGCRDDVDLPADLTTKDILWSRSWHVESTVAPTITVSNLSSGRRLVLAAHCGSFRSATDQNYVVLCGGGDKRSLFLMPNHIRNSWNIHCEWWLCGPWWCLLCL